MMRWLANVLRGMATVLDIAPAHRPTRIGPPVMSVEEALRRDWEQVGADLQAAMDAMSTAIKRAEQGECTERTHRKERTEQLLAGAAYLYCPTCDKLTVEHGDLCTVCDGPRVVVPLHVVSVQHDTDGVMEVTYWPMG